MTVRLCRVQSRCSVCSVEKFFSRTFNAVGFFHWSCAKRLTSVSSPCVLWTVKPQECAALSRFTSHPAPLFQFSEKCDAVNSEKKNKPGQVFCEWDFFPPLPLRLTFLWMKNNWKVLHETWALWRRRRLAAVRLTPPLLSPRGVAVGRGAECKSSFISRTIEGKKKKKGLKPEPLKEEMYQSPSYAGQNGRKRLKLCWSILLKRI